MNTIVITYCLAIFLIFSTTPALAQPQNKTEHDSFFHFVLENDSLGKGTDENYTSGVRLSYMDLNAELPDIAYAIADNIPTFDLNDSSSVYYSFGHNIFTPDDITIANPGPNERPYAAFAYGSLGLVSLTDDHVDDLEVTLGVIGPLAFGEEIQSFVHSEITNSPDPKGWDYQLNNEPALMLAWQRRWPEYFMKDGYGLSFGIEPNFGVTLGNVYTHANAGVNIRLGPVTEKWQDIPLRVRPAIPGTGYFEIPKDHGFSWYVFAGLEGRAVARNIFLDGNTFSDSRSVDKKPFVADANIGVAFTYDRVRVSYMLNYRSKEYNGQDDDNAVFGAFGVSYRF